MTTVFLNAKPSILPVKKNEHAAFNFNHYYGIKILFEG